MKRLLLGLLALAYSHSAWAQSTCTGELVGPFTAAQATKLCSAYMTGLDFTADPSLIALDTSDADDSKRLQLCGGGAYDVGGDRGSCIELQGNEYTGDLRMATGSETGASAYLRLNNASAVFRIQNDNGTGLWEFQESGLLDAGGTITFSSSGDTIAIDSGTAASACKGTGTFNGTTAVTVATTCAATGMHVSLTPTSDPTGSTAAYCWATNIQNGVSFDVDCDQANDGTFSWVIIKEG